MEWRLVVPVLCLIAALSGNVTSATSTTTISATNITTSAANQTANPNQAANTSHTANISHTATTNQAANTSHTANISHTATTSQAANISQAANTSHTVTTAATTVSTPAKLATINVVFRIIQEFKENYSNVSDPETIKLTESITNTFTPIYKKRFANFHRMIIRKFSRGSVVADSEIQFDNTNNTSPNVTQVINAFTDAVRTGNFSFKVDNSSINATDVTPSANVTATANPSTTNQAANTSQTTTTATTAATTASTPAKLTTINVVFRIIQEFKENYSNVSDPETIKLTESITNTFTPIYKKRFANFFRMRIKKFSRGSVVVDSDTEFDNTNNTSPNVTEVIKAFTEAILTGNFSFKVDNSSINATDVTPIATTQAATTLESIEGFNLTFKMTGNFTSDLSNMSSPAATNLTDKVIGQLNKVFKTLLGHRRTLVRWFRNGSIAVDAGVEFNRASRPTVETLAKALADGVRNGVVDLPIDTKTIQFTDSAGATANKSPVLASMLTAFWMTLASLLLSAVMH